MLHRITSIGMPLSMALLFFLLIVYLSFEELRNLPGKCVINLCGALLCYQALFLSTEKSTEVPILCQAVVILLHFFVRSAFSWMTVMAKDTASTFTTTGNWNRNRETHTNTNPVQKFFFKETGVSLSYN